MRALMSRLAATRTRLTGRRTAVREESGAVAIYLVIFAIAFLAAAGLVVDGGYTMAAKRQAIGQAEQASRIGADALSEGSLRSGDPSVNAARAQGRAQDYLRQIGARGSVAVASDRVTVRVRAIEPMRILSAVGVPPARVTGTASATSIDEDTDPGGLGGRE